MVHDYIERELFRKNIGVYFKKGKWVLHVLFFVAFLATFNFKLNENVLVVSSGNTTLGALISTLPFLVFFYIYCLYLVPACFKRNKIRKFWLLLSVMLLVFPLLDIMIQAAAAPYFPAIKTRMAGMTSAAFLLEAYKTFIGYFTGFTSMLFLMELLEGVRTTREIDDNKRQLLATESQLIKTRMDPDFINQSLDGITRLATLRDAAAPDSVIRFSDVLRYRLYRSAERMVPLEEELQQLGNLVHFHNDIHEADAFCTVEIEGFAAGKSIPPLALINVVESLLNRYKPGTAWSALFYLLIEEHELQMAIELTLDSNEIYSATAVIKNNLQSIFGTTASFSMETDGDANSIRICIPIQNNSIASS
jgi:two-component system LytT family sensor kinase